LGAADLSRFLGDRGIAVGQARKVAPSLEDVFVQLVSGGHEERIVS